MLKFSPANTKIKKLKTVPGVKSFLDGKRKIYSLDLLSGHYCPYAHDCLSKTIEVNGVRRIQDGPHTKFRCFSASQEALLPAVYNSRKHNSDLLRSLNTSGSMAQAIADAMPQNLGVCRIHVAGDFFNQRYFDAWLQVVKHNPHRLFYAYTKSLPMWLYRRSIVERLENLVLTASYGGRKDSLIKAEKLRYAVVVFSENEAIARGLEIDHDDSHAADPTKRKNSFALLIHGVQPKGSLASKALSKVVK